MGRTSIACQCMSISPGISVRPSPGMVLVSARSAAIGSREIFSILFPRTRTFMLALNASFLPSKTRTFSKRMLVAGSAGCANAAGNKNGIAAERRSDPIAVRFMGLSSTELTFSKRT